MTISGKQYFGLKVILPSHNLQMEKDCGFILFILHPAAYSTH